MRNLLYVLLLLPFYVNNMAVFNWEQLMLHVRFVSLTYVNWNIAKLSFANHQQ